MEAQNTKITTLGESGNRSPLTLSTVFGDGYGDFVPEAARVRYQTEVNTGLDKPDLLFEKAGPREKIFFDPAHTRAAIVTCGGLCPGLNNVIRSLVLELHHNYGVSDILGIRYGYRGLNPEVADAPIVLTPPLVDEIHEHGGTILSTSRGAQDVATMVDYLESEGVNLLFCVGGDGTQRGAHEIAEEVLNRKLKIAVVGIPKTIDNDILYVRRTFGFSTAIDEARKVLDCAHAEAKGALNGIGLVKVMGRESGLIAVGATLASQEVNFALIPEVPLVLEGEKGFLPVLRERILKRRHAVIVVAEGAGQDVAGRAEEAFDVSGNRVLKDIGVFLKHSIKTYFEGEDIPVSVKYIDPSYIIRSVTANSDDSIMCDHYARHAVHAAMAGKTDCLVGSWSGSYMLVPLALVIAGRQSVDPESEIWESVISTTGQPRRWA